MSTREKKDAELPKIHEFTVTTIFPSCWLDSRYRCASDDLRERERLRDHRFQVPFRESAQNELLRA